MRISADYEHLIGIPKALLPGVGGKRILDYWWEAIKTRQLFSEVYLVTNAGKYKHFERWATASDFPVENIINDGTTTFEHRLGSVADFELVTRTKNVQDDVMVVAGDMLFQDSKFDVAQVIAYFRLRRMDLAVYYEMLPEETMNTRGIVELDSDNRIQKFFEKPCENQTSSRLASVVFYCLQHDTLSTCAEYLQQTSCCVEDKNFGKYMEWLINVRKRPVCGMKLPTGFQLIGQVGLSEYTQWVQFFSGKQQLESRTQPIISRAYARVGLIGNPSDGFYGKTIAMTISNFWAEVTISESEQLVLVPHPLNDPTSFGSLSDLYMTSRKEGYLGGLRLLQATCKKFFQYCSERGIALAKRNFTLKYDTNIPRQVGLAGSSAIVTATMKCLMRFFSLTEHDLPKALLPQFILDVEKQELFIQAGLQDRVVQVYEGLVYMDFSKELFEKQSHGKYECMDATSLPKFWLAYQSDPSDSGKIHSDVSIRWKNGAPDVVAAMKTFAQLTDLARNAVNNADWITLAELMNKNFDLRRQIYGDAALGAGNIHMIELARSFGSAAKFPGSGGAIIGLCLDSNKLTELKKAFQAEGCVFCEIIPYSP